MEGVGYEGFEMALTLFLNHFIMPEPVIPEGKIDDSKPTINLLPEGQEPPTPQAGESRTPETPTPAPQAAAPAAAPTAQENSDSAQASAKARELGEDRRAMLETMFKAAEGSEEAKAALIEQLESRPSLKKVAEEKFGERVSKLYGKVATKGEQATTEELKMAARAEAYLEMERKEEHEMVTQMAVKISMNQEEADRLERLARAYQKEAGVEFKEALVKMARAEKPDHASALSMPSAAATNAAPPVNTVVPNAEDRSLAQAIGKTPEWVAEMRTKADQGQKDDGVFRISLQS